jgi:hypothetical protein
VPRGDALSGYQHSTLPQLFTEVEVFLTPLSNAVNLHGGVYNLLAARGWDLDALKEADLTAFATLLTSLVEDLAGLSSQTFESFENVTRVIADLGQLLNELDEVRDTLVAAIGVELSSEQAEALVGDIFEALVFVYLPKRFPATYQALIALTLIDIEVAQTLLGTGGNVDRILRYPVRRPTLRLENIAKLLTDPVPHFKAEYFPESGFATEASAREFVTRLFGRLEAIVLSLGGQAMAGLREPLQRVPVIVVHSQPRKTLKA